MLIAILPALSVSAQLPGQLPVNLKVFTARAEVKDRVKIFWTTEYEKDNGFFEIERSTDAVSFTSVGRLPGKNLNGILTDYIYVDDHALKGISYYRLKMVDIDQHYSYSQIVRVNNAESGNALDIYPNPSTNGQFNIGISKTGIGSATILIYDALGRLATQQKINYTGAVKITHALPAGQYLVKVAGTGFSASKKILVQ